MTQYKKAGSAHVFDTRNEREWTPEEIEADQREWAARQIQVLEENADFFTTDELAQISAVIEKEIARRKATEGKDAA